MTTIQKDVDEDTGYENTNAAVDDILKRWKAAEKPSDTDDGDTADEAAETDHPADTDADATSEDEADADQSDDAENDDDAENEDEGDKKFADDDVFVKYTVDGKEQTVSVKELKRLAGQEASLTRKSQEVAAQRKAVDTQATKHLVGLTKMVENATADYEPYAKIDFIRAARDLAPEDYDALRKEAEQKYERYRFLTQELDGTVKTFDAERAQARQHAAINAIKVLSDPDGGIPDWSQELYGKIREHALTSGVDVEIFDGVTDPSMIKLFHKAMLHDSVKKVATKKANKAPKKVLKSTRKVAPLEGDKARKALDKLKSDGSRQSAADAWLARHSDD